MTHANKVCIVAASRTPIGGYNGSLASLSAIQLGSLAVKGMLEKFNIPNTEIEEFILGNVLSANLGQNPARQVAFAAGLPSATICTTVNRVCSSGMKAIICGAQSVLCGNAEVVLVGGVESMSNVPYYSSNARFGAKYGHQQLLDGIIQDGLWDTTNSYLMGNAAELCAREHRVSREDQDAYAVESYERAQNATFDGLFKNEIIPIEVKGPKRGSVRTITEDDEIRNLIPEKVGTVKSPFEKEGSVTAANSSPLSDGAAFLVLMTQEKAKSLNLQVLATIRGWGEAAQEPEKFTTSPSLAIPKALHHANITQDQVDYFEVNEAFSVVAIANQRLLNIPPEKLNVHGGAVALGHPLGCSGARIVVTLINVLNQRKGKLGVAGVCNGGGGATSLVIEMQ